MAYKEIKLKNLKKTEELFKVGKWGDVEKLKYMLYNIDPYSRYWRWGMVSALKHAIKLLEMEQKGRK